MTDEQLNEIEKLAEAWGRHEHFSDAPPLAKRVLPLVKALREARAERDEALGDARLAESQLDEIVELAGSGGDGSAFGSVESLLCDLKARTEERDEARAEVARLRKLLNREQKPDLGAALMRLIREDQRKAIYSQAWQEAILAGNTREQAHRIAADAASAALKEGDR